MITNTQTAIGLYLYLFNRVELDAGHGWILEASIASLVNSVEERKECDTFAARSSARAVPALVRPVAAVVCRNTQHISPAGDYG